MRLYKKVSKSRETFKVRDFVNTSANVSFEAKIKKNDGFLKTSICVQKLVFYSNSSTVM